MTTRLRVALYVRVSTDRQETENQRLQLVAECERRGMEVVAVYEEEESAWAGGHQAALRRAFQDGKRGRFRILWTWALDRLSREGPLKMLLAVDRFAQIGVRVVSMQEEWTWADGPEKEIMLAIVAWVAKGASDRRSQDTKAGMQRAAQTGTKSGKAIGRPKGKTDSKPRRAKRVRVPDISEWR